MSEKGEQNSTASDSKASLVKSLSAGRSGSTERIAEATASRQAPNFIAKLHRQKVTVRQPGQPALNGVLSGFAPYELLITDDRGRDHLVFKGPGLVLDLPEGWRRSRTPEPEASGDGGSV